MFKQGKDIINSDLGKVTVMNVENRLERSKPGGRESSWRALQQFRQDTLRAWTVIVVVEMERL